ncbi:MAG: glycogen/starch synthase [Planctomycetota bacterium]
MFQEPKKLRVAMVAWEIGRARSGLGSKLGGLGVIVEELPPELVKAAARRGIELEIVTLSPCFAHYDKSQLKKLDLQLPVTLDGHTFKFEAYEHTFTDNVDFSDGVRAVNFKMVYFWDEWQLNWTNADTIYPDDPQIALKLYAAVSQAMAAYIKQHDFQIAHFHDYHVGLTPIYLGDDYLRRVATHLTVHNATYQGIIPPVGGGSATLSRIGLHGENLYHKYFEHFGKLCLLKAALLKTVESDGQITTVSGNLEGAWGYAAELMAGRDQLWAKAWAQKGSPPGEIFLPNCGLELFEKLPILGITNGMSVNNRPENLPELKAAALREMQSKRGQQPLFANPITQQEMIGRDHNFDAAHLDMKQQLRRLLYFEAFGHEPFGFPIILTVVGRLTEQKNLGLVGDIIPRVLDYDPQVKFVILASALKKDLPGKATERDFQRLAQTYHGRVYFNNSFNQALSKLILAGGDFTLIPSRFEPCGLVDYEAALLGTIPIAHAIGGLTKIRHCGYLYEWLDIRNREGEANAFFLKVKEAIDTYRRNYPRHLELMRAAMATDVSWNQSAEQYLDIYRYGLLAKRWRAGREQFLHAFAESLGQDRSMFARFFTPRYGPHGDEYDWQLKNIL